MNYQLVGVSNKKEKERRKKGKKKRKKEIRTDRGRVKIHMGKVNYQN